MPFGEGNLEVVAVERTHRGASLSRFAGAWHAHAGVLMNLLLLDSDELDGDGRVRLGGRRARHLVEVLEVAPGQSLRAGIRRGSLGEAIVSEVDGAEVEVVYRATRPATVEPAVDLVLALPRPKVLSRILQHVAAMGVGRVDLINAWRVDKSYFDSPRLVPAALDADVVLGCEQGRHTWTPEVTVHRRFMSFCQSLAPDDSRLRLVADPGAGSRLPELGALVAGGRTVVAIGPEGGWIERERATLDELGFVAVELMEAVLRTEAAVIAALAQLDLVRLSSRD